MNEFSDQIKQKLQSDMIRFFMLIYICCLSCAPQNKTVANDAQKFISNPDLELTIPENLINPSGKTVMDRFMLPPGFEREARDDGSFATYLRNLPLKPDGSKVHYYDGRTKSGTNVYDAVVDLEIGKRDLHQCADAVIRLRAEYLWKKQDYNSIHFNFTNGFRVDYSRWMNGERISINGNEASWVDKNREGNEYNDFWSYLEIIWSYAGTLSLDKELLSVDFDDLQIGDVFIQGGSPGHAIIVVDLSMNRQTGEKLFLLAQSYMPAQELQILKNPSSSKYGPWYSTSTGGQIVTPEWTFSRSDLKRFGE